MKTMKICVLLIAVTLLCLAGCNSREAVPEQEIFTFTYNGTIIALNADAAPVIAALGEPQKYTEEPSCAFDGLDKTYFYSSFYLSTYPLDGKDYVYSIWFADETVSTAEDIRIGSTRAEVDAAYGADQFNGTNAYSLTKGASKLTIILTDDIVSSIRYDAIN